MLQNSMKELIKKIPFTKSIFNFFYDEVINRLHLISLGIYTTVRTIKYSRANNNIESWKASMRVSCHIIEKGLTMPEKRLGFGQDRVLIVIREILSDENFKYFYEIKMAVGIIKEYDKLHKEMGYALPVSLQQQLDRVLDLYPKVQNLDQIKVKRNDFFFVK